MQYIDKIYKLHNLLKSRRQPIRGVDIDEKLECNTSTRKRIIGNLRNLGAPLNCERSKGYSYDPDDPRGEFELPGIWLSAEELQALIACQHILGNIAPGLVRHGIDQLRKHLQRLLIKTTGVQALQLGRIKILSQAYRSRDDALFIKIAEAVFNQQMLTIEYHARGSDLTSQRQISPQNLVLYKDNWYLDAFCHERQAPRTFALDRIANAESIMETAIQLDPDELQRHYGSSYGIFAGQAQHTAILNFSAQAAKWVADEHWHSQQQGQWLCDGRYQLRFPFNRHEELLMDVMKWGAEVEVIGPEFLRTLVKQEALKLVSKYQ